MRIFIDADGCPVVDIAVKTANENNVEINIVCDTAHNFEFESAKTIVVSKGADSVDYMIANLISAKDIVITQDYGLAAMCLAKKAIVIDQNGMEYTDQNIDSLLFRRHLAKKIRNSGGRIKGPQKRNKLQNSKFEISLKNIIKREKENGH